MGWRDKYNEWRDNHDFKQYESRKKCDEVIDQKLVELLDEQEAVITQLQKKSTKIDYEKCKTCRESSCPKNISFCVDNNFIYFKG